MKVLSRASLFVFGLALGVFGVRIAEKTGALSAIAHAGAGSTVADACTPATANAQDDIFFVSCGGIY